MKRIFITCLILFFGLFIFTSCNEDEKKEFQSKGVVTGFDPRDCACCGGVLINVDSDSTELFTSKTYVIHSKPNDFIVNESTQFPIFVKLDWTETKGFCIKAINISRIEKR